MIPKNSSLIRLTSDYQIKPFNCGDADLNDFLFNDARNYLKELFTVTYILENSEETIAFFSLLNDRISINDTDSERFWKKQFNKSIPFNKRRSSYPAVKIGRLGVNQHFKNQHIGTAIIDYIKQLFIINNRTGCRFITVDAYKESVNFYSKNDFKFLTTQDAGEDTRLMYFDLKRVPKE